MLFVETHELCTEAGVETSLHLPESRLLAAGHDSLALGVAEAPQGTIFALALAGGISVGPREGCTIVFGRNCPDVHVCVGEEDRRVSRRQGVLTRHDQRWWIANAGRVAVRLPGGRILFPEQEPIPLADGYTPVFVPGTGGREHLLELYVVGDVRPPPIPQAYDGRWRLSATEHLALVVLAQRYLMAEPFPQPLSWSQAADHLADLEPDAGWTAKRLAHVVAAVRARLSEQGVPALVREEVGEPLGNALNQNLIRELLETATLTPMDLRLLHPFDD